jgi:S-adenosylmethionine hydrolase
MLPRPNGIVTLLSDLGPGDAGIGLLKGMVLRESRQVTCIDLHHGLEPGDVPAAAFVAWSAIGRFPAGTVHVVATEVPGRRLLAAATPDSFWVGPDNGTLSAVLEANEGAEVREVGREALGLDVRSCGDAAAAVGAWIAGGRYGYRALGPVATGLVDLDLFGGPPRCVHVDARGNVVTNQRAAAVQGRSLLWIGHRRIPLLVGDASAELSARVGRLGLVEIVARGGRASAMLGIGPGAAIDLEAE